MPKIDNRKNQYEVLIDFIDAQDNMTSYRAGKDKYPRVGYDPTAERIEYLQGDKNTLGKPIITKK